LSEVLAAFLVEETSTYRALQAILSRRAFVRFLLQTLTSAALEPFVCAPDKALLVTLEESVCVQELQIIRLGGLSLVLAIALVAMGGQSYFSTAVRKCKRALLRRLLQAATVLAAVKSHCKAATAFMGLLAPSKSVLVGGPHLQTL
jgi:hypothetical protein